jgi:hypothetical protein
MATATYGKCADKARQFAQYCGKAHTLSWRNLKQTCREFGQVSLEEVEPPGVENPTAEDRRLLETALILVGHEHGLILLREAYGSRLCFEGKFAVDEDPFADQ